ncbi:cytochrome P450 [Streptomyces sp. NPDC046994]|uniref:cytochrome P450 family protein n=1 Tax=Streptomyces sp. NPDC046994 TaxID=3155735 RepID=UPI003454776A
MTSLSPQQPYVLDPTGADRNTEHKALHAGGSATSVDILGVTAKAIADPAVLKRLLTSPDISKDGRAHWPPFEEVIQRWPLKLWIDVDNMFTAYGGSHRRLRRLIAPAFSARRIAALGEVVETIVSDILDTLATRPAGEIIDLREQLAFPVPIAVIAGLLGFSPSQARGFRVIVDGVFDTTLTVDEANQNASALYEVMDELIASKRAHPGEDLTSLLIAVRDSEGDGSGLSEAELRGTLMLMISAGYETTVNVIDQAITLLLAHPEQLEHVRSGRAVWSDVVEETLRLEPPATHIPLRYAINDVDLPDGTTIDKGEAVLASVGAANRHPSWHGETADAYDVTRVTQEHLAFGHGVHFCLGAPLARMEVKTVLEQLFHRFPKIELAVPAAELTPINSLISNGHQQLPVRLRPAVH